MCVGYLGQMIERDAGSFQTAVALRYSFDGERLLGTAGALRRALRLLPETFFVLYGDSYLPCDYAAVAEAFHRSGQPALMTVFRNEGRFDTSNVEYADGRIVRYQKNAPDDRMHHIDYGLGIFRREVIERIPPDEPHDLADVYRSLVAECSLAAFEVAERFYEIGSVEGIRELEAYLRSRSLDLPLC